MKMNYSGKIEPGALDYLNKSLLAFGFIVIRGVRTMAGNQDDLLFFSKDAEKPLEYGSLKKWKVLIVDDEPEVHSITTLVLQDFNFEEKGLEFYHAYTAQ